MTTGRCPAFFTTSSLPKKQLVKMMKRSPSKTPLSILIFIIISALHLEAFGQMKTFHYVGENKTWFEARQYCKENYNDLASVSHGEIELLTNLITANDVVWIGLYMQPESISVWRWTEGSGDASSDTNWATGEPERRNCTRLTDPDQLWYLTKCSAAHYFYCSKEDNVLYVTTRMSWLDAQEHCKKMSMDLATVTRSNKRKFTGAGWIGLHIPPEKHRQWKWTGKDSGYRNWAPGQQNPDDCGSLSFSTNRWQWHSSPCSRLLPFICFVNTNPVTTNPGPNPNMVLVKENKTWEEALEHCRDIGAGPSQPDRYRDPRYDLVSLQSEDDHRYARVRIQGATTNEVWTALRFLAGEWLWVDEEPRLYQNLPLCPAWGRHCGTLPKDRTAQWQIRDCTERRNFLCIKSPARYYL